MAVLDVLRLGHPVLRNKSKEIPPVDVGRESLQTLIDDMVHTLREYDGVGLAAPQVGEPVRLVVMECRENPRYPDTPEIPLTILINPVIRFLSQDKVTGWEGCLSVPSLRGRVSRYRELVVEALDRAGRPVKFPARDFFAVVAQHEVDHLDGVLFFDRMTSLETLTFTDEFKRYWAKDEEQ